MRYDLFSNDIQPDCCYCAHGMAAHTPDQILCKKAGVVHPGFSCKRFEYSPLKRIPKKLPRLPRHDPSEFQL